MQFCPLHAANTTQSSFCLRDRPVTQIWIQSLQFHVQSLLFRWPTFFLEEKLPINPLATSRQNERRSFFDFLCIVSEAKIYEFSKEPSIMCDKHLFHHFWITLEYYSSSPADLPGLLPSYIADSWEAKVQVYYINFGPIRILSFDLRILVHWVILPCASL